ncbi:MAG TPA: hypothetical protein VKV05_11755 [Terriglobales bacterium]|nr:hypothetical protein [Terriglobales bacterium]
MKLLRLLGIATLVVCAVAAATAQTWTPVQGVPNIGAGAMALLTNGCVLVHDESGNAGTWQNWWTLCPDINGNYATGSWTQVASLPSNYGPLYFGSAVLPDGRYIIEGGEYNNGSPAWTNQGAIYDPVANTWTQVNPPSGWSQIGDAASSVLQDGTWMLGSCCVTPPSTALLNASTLSWTSTGSGKFDVYDEEGLTLLPGGKVLDVDAYVFRYQSNGMNYETYDPTTGAWTSQGNTPEQYWDSAANCGGQGSASFEEGPAVLMPNGTVFQAGANSCAAGHTGIYTVSSGTWQAGPDFPGTFDIADGPAALEVNGNVMMFASPGIFNTGGQMFEWNGSTLTQLPNPPNGSSDSSYYGHLLMLPTGQIMFTDFSSDVELFTSAGSQYTGWNPTVLLTSAVFARGHSYLMQGYKFNGASQNNAYGDDFQDATNYPIVRLTNVSTGHVFYARTHDHSTMAVGYGGPAYTHVDIPANMETGSTKLQVIVNGIASQDYLIGID